MKSSQFLVPLIIVMAAVLLATACQSSPSADGQQTSAAESMLSTAVENRDYQWLLVMTDSLGKRHAISDAAADYYRGIAYSYLGQLRNAENAWMRVVSQPRHSEADLTYYYESAASLAGLMVNRRNYEGALRVAVPAVKMMEDTKSTQNIIHALLHESIGRCQMNLERDAEADENFGHAFDMYMEEVAVDEGAEPLRHAIVCVYNTTLGYLHAKRYKEARLWTHRADSLAALYAQKSDANQAFAQRVKASLLLQNAVSLEGEGQTQKAAQFYHDYQQTPYGQSEDGLIDGTSYLMVARRLDEAAKSYELLTPVLGKWGMDYTLDNVQGFLFPKFRANIGAGRKDSALAVALQTFELLDSAIEHAKKSDAAELATVYETQQKETEIARQQADLSRQRWIGTLAASLLLTAFFVFYILYRRRAQRRLAVTHERLQDTFNELQTAYDQLQKTTEAKERMEGELRIARDIQLSMVPSVFPEHEKLDLYASMVAAKHVGGDLYDYVLLGNHLYFCLGDVAGKGVPASLVMAQTTRLFRSLATQETLPAQIAQRINTEMTQHHSAHGMFVTMFIGLLDLQTGRLQYCNAGHNPPVLGGDTAGGSFLEMESNAPVGLWEELEYVGEEIASIKGRPLFIYSDGLTEAENPSLEQFGEERLLEVLHHTRFHSAHQVIERLTEEVERHRQGQEPNDDMTMMCLKLY